MSPFKKKNIDSITLSNWVIQNSPDRSISPLKLQKLIFYCYGAAASQNLEDEIGEIEFQAWKYGPVVAEVYDHFKKYGSNTIDREKTTVSFSSELQELLKSIISIYGKIKANDLITQTHLEDPWKKAFSNGETIIENEDIKRYFTKRFAENEIRVPEMLSDSGFFEIDNLPVRKFNSLKKLASFVSQQSK